MKMIGITCEGCGKTLLDCLDKCNKCGRPYNEIARKASRVYQEAKVRGQVAELAAAQIQLAGAEERFGGKVPEELIERVYGIK